MFEGGLKVARRLYSATDFPDGHPTLATSLNSLAAVYESQAKYADAEPLYTAALAMNKPGRCLQLVIGIQSRFSREVGDVSVPTSADRSCSSGRNLSLDPRPQQPPPDANPTA